jgi:WhiB family redox-sensing transcriptional regulator
MTVIHMSARHLTASEPAGRERFRWEDYASCRETDPDLFHPTGRDVTMLRAAKDVCSGCPVRRSCLQDALDSQEDQGVRGGLSEEERRRIHRRPSTAPHQAGMPTRAEAIAAEPGRYLQLVAEGRALFEIAKDLGTNVQTINNVARILAGNSATDCSAAGGGDGVAVGGVVSGPAAADGREPDQEDAA